jgi:hypothetical protein
MRETNIYPLQAPVPLYAWHLLLAAKALCCDKDACRKYPHLNDAIKHFEESMPFDPDTGEVLVASKVWRVQR